MADEQFYMTGQPVDAYLRWERKLKIHMQDVKRNEDLAEFYRKTIVEERLTPYEREVMYNGWKMAQAKLDTVIQQYMQHLKDCPNV